MSVLKFRNPNYVEGGTEEKWITLQTGGGGIEDAPVDGNQYVRQDGEWTEVVIPEVDVQEAPMDGNQYARQDGQWTEVIVPTATSELTNDSGFITEVPSEYVTETKLESALSEIDVPAGFIAQDSEPSDTDVLWVDTSDNSSESTNNISVDAYMSDTSTNPVQNMIVKQYIDSMFQVVSESEYEALGDSVNTDGVIYLITQ